MEAGGIYVACMAENVDWIVVKAVCDFADGYKALDKDSRQRLAAKNSAEFVRHALQFLLPKRVIIATLLASAIVLAFPVAYLWTRPPSLYPKHAWSWAASGGLGRSEWRFPGSAWAVESLGDKPELVINGQTGQAGWPHEFDENRLTDFVLRFKMRFPDDLDADGTKLVWMVRTQDQHWIIRVLEGTDVDSIGGYEFSLVKKGKELYIAGHVVRNLFSGPSSLNKPLHLGLHCCQGTTEYEVIVRAYHDQLDNCITAISPTDLTTGRPADPDSGHPALAHFQDSTFSQGSVAFASGDAAKRVIVRDIEVINLAPEFKTDLSRDPNHEYFLSKDFECQ